MGGKIGEDEEGWVEKDVSVRVSEWAGSDKKEMYGVERLWVGRWE